MLCTLGNRLGLTLFDFGEAGPVGRGEDTLVGPMQSNNQIETRI